MNEYAERTEKVSRWMKIDEQLKKRALDCRKVRMFLATHPGSTSREIADGTGVKSSTPLFKMQGMGIIRVENQDSIKRWYVVPQ